MLLRMVLRCVSSLIQVFLVVDLSHYGRIRVSGEDRVQFLHNQSTANFEILHEGQGCDTVFVTPTARTIDIAHAWVMVHILCRQS